MLAGGLLALVGVTFALSEWPPGVSRPVLSRQAPATAAVKVIRATAVQQAFSPPDLTHPAMLFKVTAVHFSSAATEPASDSELRRLVERRVLQQLPVQAGRLIPRSVINRSSGMLRNNIRVACHAAHVVGSFTCTVFSPSGSRVAALSARVLVRRLVVLGR
jgi:hypothetical protein